MWFDFHHIDLNWCNFCNINHITGFRISWENGSHKKQCTGRVFFRQVFMWFCLSTNLRCDSPQWACCSGHSFIRLSSWRCESPGAAAIETRCDGIHHVPVGMIKKIWALKKATLVVWGYIRDDIRELYLYTHYIYILYIIYNIIYIYII